jgi:solute carrier family 25 phosphate transporter 23/24/25/41
MLFNIFFGAIVKIAKPQRGSLSFPTQSVPPQSATAFGQVAPDGTADGSMFDVNHGHFIKGTLGPDAQPGFPFPIPTPEADDQDLSSEIASPEKKSLLISLLPDSGYFAIGACAGVVSRTCTAPLDRLKVYLIAHTNPIDNSLTVAKKGNVAEATRKFGQPIILAYKDLLQAGGWRNLFAGKPTYGYV